VCSPLAHHRSAHVADAISLAGTTVSCRRRYEERNILDVARLIAHCALAREESRGAHQREDFPQTDAAWAYPQYVRMARTGTLAVGRA